jgi:hypothetical protein
MTKPSARYTGMNFDIVLILSMTRINIVIGIWSSNSSVYISKWLCHDVFILYIFHFAKIKWNFILDT